MALLSFISLCFTRLLTEQRCTKHRLGKQPSNITNRQQTYAITEAQQGCRNAYSFVQAEY
jgi:hypothetical protein